MEVVNELWENIIFYKSLQPNSHRNKVYMYVGKYVKQLWLLKAYWCAVSMFQPPIQSRVVAVKDVNAVDEHSRCATGPGTLDY